MTLMNYRVAWRSKTGKDYGLEVVPAQCADDARGWFEATYPDRRATLVTLEATTKP